MESNVNNDTKDDKKKPKRNKNEMHDTLSGLFFLLFFVFLSIVYHGQQRQYTTTIALYCFHRKSSSKWFLKLRWWWCDSECEWNNVKKFIIRPNDHRIDLNIANVILMALPKCVCMCAGIYWMATWAEEKKKKKKKIEPEFSFRTYRIERWNEQQTKKILHRTEQYGPNTMYSTERIPYTLEQPAHSVALL